MAAKKTAKKTAPKPKEDPRSVEDYVEEMMRAPEPLSRDAALAEALQKGLRYKGR